VRSIGSQAMCTGMATLSPKGDSLPGVESEITRLLPWIAGGMPLAFMSLPLSATCNGQPPRIFLTRKGD
jgi:hypothetical protein